MISPKNPSADYTSADFMSKLLGKSFQSQNQTSGLHFSTASTKSIDIVNDKKQFQRHLSPKTQSMKQISFRPINNGQSSLIKIKLSPNRNQSRRVLQVKQPSVKLTDTDGMNSINRVQHQNPESLPITEKQDNVKQQNSAYQKTQINENIVEGQCENEKYQTNSLTIEQDLVLKKAQLFFRAALQHKIKNEQISNLLQELKKGLSNPQEFDKVIEKFSQNPCQLQGKVQQQPFSHRQHVKSMSLKKKVNNQQVKSQKRNKSEQKQPVIQVNRKTKKTKQEKTKAQILRQIRKLKQKVLVNQKSLRLARKTSLK